MKLRAFAFAIVGLLSLAAGAACSNESAWSRRMQVGEVALERGDYEGAVQAVEAAARRAEAFGESDRRLLETLTALAMLYDIQGRAAEAGALYQRVREREKASDPEFSIDAVRPFKLAERLKEQGRYSAAEPLLRRALALDEQALGAEHSAVATDLNELGELLIIQGRYHEAEALHKRALAINEKRLGPEHPRVGADLNNLAVVYHYQGRFPEAELLQKRALAMTEKALGGDHPQVATDLFNLAELYKDEGRYAQAESLLKRSVEIAEKRFGAEDFYVARGLSGLAGLYKAQGRLEEAEPLYARALAIIERQSGAEHANAGITLVAMAEVLARQARYAEAEVRLKRALAILERALGPEHPNLATSLNNLAALYRAQKRLDEGLASARRASAILAKRYAAREDTRRRGALAEQRTQSGGFEGHVALLALQGQTQPESQAAAAQESFRIAQLARASDTADQVARMAARFAAGSDALAQLARQRQDLFAHAEQLDAALLREISKPTTQRDGEREQRLRAEQADLSRKLAELDMRLGREFPQYQELADPRPLAVEAAQKLLGTEEALVVFLVARDESYVWALRPGEATFQRLALTRAELDALVRKLRAQLDLGAGDPSAVVSRPFDAATANELYRKLFGPVQSLLGGVRHLLIVPDGALQSLPLGVLVTEPPKGPLNKPADHAQLAWLVKKYAMTVLPSVSSLRALRAFAGAKPGTEPFSGFGNPVLEGGAGASRGVTLAALFSRGPIANVSEVRKLQPLPETADELRAIATTLRAPSDALYLGPQASETKVKSLDLSRYRNLAFATHGLMAGEFKGVVEPALVLTPPAQGTELDDGLLTAGEIAQLKLNADWVILSACNTAAADGTPGAEGLSGLAKAFFYAGARSLLVSHWAVSSDAAVALTTRMFEEAGQGASKAEALQRSMLALMQRSDKPYFAHPAFWAPFIVVGEGGNPPAGQARAGAGK